MRVRDAARLPGWEEACGEAEVKRVKVSDGGGRRDMVELFVLWGNNDY